MNILYLTNNGGRASTTVATRGWIDALAKKGLRPTIASPKLGEFTGWARDAYGVDSYAVDLSPPSKRNLIPYVRSLWRLTRIVKTHRTDIIHSNEHDCYPVASHLARTCGVPISVSVHFSMERAYCEWAFGGRREPDLMCFVSQRTLDQCRPALAGVVRDDRLKVLHNGLDLARYRPAHNMRIEFRRKYMSGFDWAIGVACALRPRKQLEHLFEGFGLLSTPRVRLFVAGFAVKGDERYAADLIADAKRRFDERFIFLGSLDDLRPLTNGLDLFINTSQEESFGIAVLEAMATGCPVIGYDSKAVDEVVLPNGGQITPQDDVVLLSQAIDQWLQNPSRIESARALAVSQAQRFDIRKLSGQLWDEYKAMLRESESGKRNSAITIC